MSVKITYILFFMMLVKLNLHAQTLIWSENFNSYPDGTTSGGNNNATNPSSDWSASGCISCNPLVGDWWEVRSGRMEARDVNEDYVSFVTEVINITGYPAIYFQVECSEVGDHEGLYDGADNCSDINNQDFVDIEYAIDGGFWNLLQNYEAWCGLYATCGTHTFYGDDGADGDCRTTDADWVSSTVQILGLSGFTIQFRLSARNSADDEIIRFDNITVVGYDPLPIELVDFRAIQNGTTVQLDWNTSSEQNNEKFTIERSQNGMTWEETHSQPGAGNSQTLINYQALDVRPYIGMSYYRLKQTDFDGNFSFSEIQSLNFIVTDDDYTIFPNPARRNVIIRGKNIVNANLTILDEFGKVCWQKIMTESSEETIDISELREGIYQVHINNGDKIIVKKLVVLK